MDASLLRSFSRSANSNGHDAHRCGALVALLDADDPYHTACVAAAQRLPAGPLLTTWVCFTVAMYLLGSVGEYRYQAALWSLRATGRVVLHDLPQRKPTVWRP